MENQSNSVTPLAMSYGLYMGLALILNAVIFYVMGIPFSPFCGVFTYAIIIVGLIQAMRTYRDHQGEGGVSYGKALGLGTLQALFASLIYAFFTFVLFKLVDKTLMDKFLAFMEEKFIEGGMKETQIDVLMPFYRKFMTPASYSFGQILTVTFLGFLFSLVLGIFFKKPSTDPFHGVE